MRSRWFWGGARCPQGAGSGVAHRVCVSPAHPKPSRVPLRMKTLLVAMLVSPLSAAPHPAPAEAFIEKYCAGCHDDVEKKGGLDLTSLKFALSDTANFQSWLKVHDRLQAGDVITSTLKFQIGA